MMMHHFTKEHGSYYFWCGRQLIYMADELTIAFDYSTWVLLKHGVPDAVQRWLAMFREKLPPPSIFDDIGTISGNSFEVEELNRLISNSTYIETFAKKHGFEAPSPV